MAFSAGPNDTLSDRKTARALLRDWNTYFPEFHAWRKHSMVRIVGPIMQDILLERSVDGTAYLPRFGVRLLSTPEMVYGYLYSYKSLSTTRLFIRPERWINLVDHRKLLPEAAMTMRERLAYLPVDGSLTFNQAYRAIGHYMLAYPTAWPNIATDAVLLCTWAGRVRLAMSTLIATRVLSYGPHGWLGSYAYHPPPRKLVCDTEAVQEIAEENVKRLKLTSIPRQELIS